MKKILAIVLMMAVLVCPALASGEAAPVDAAAETAEDSAVLNYAMEITKEATCTEEGIITFYDKTTGEAFIVVTTAPIDHEYEVTATTEPSCTEEGAVIYTCAVCGETYTEKTAPALGHSYTYQHDAVQNEDGSFISYGTWACDRCGDVVLATEGNALYYYVLGEAEAADAAEGAESVRAAEDEEAAEGEEAVEDASATEAEDASATEAGGGEEGASGSGYDPAAHNWAAIEIVLALVIVAVGAILMLSFGKKKNED